MLGVIILNTVFMFYIYYLINRRYDIDIEWKTSVANIFGNILDTLNDIVEIDEKEENNNDIKEGEKNNEIQ